ncbi:TPA: hypothetical protein ACH3X1_000982 [Trebouxia sp. C0004]
MSVASYTDKHKFSASQNKVIQHLLLLALIMGGVPFAFVANLQFQNFLHCLRPSFVPPGLIMLRGSLLDGLHGEILVQHAAWLADEKLARHLTLFIDGWSNARMESIYAICVMFPDRRAILLDALDLSSLTHSAENIADALQTLFVCILKVTMSVSTHACRDCYQDHKPI